MAYYERSDSYYDYGDYQSDSRRNSNSFSEEINVPKRKKSNWGGRGRGGGRQFSSGGGNRKPSPRNASLRDLMIDTPLYPEPKRTPQPPRRSPQMPPPPRRSPQIPVDGRKRGRERNNSFRSNDNVQPCFEMRDMPEFVEREHSGPDWHWENYVRGCKNWQDKHKLAYYQSRCTALEFENQMLFEQINQLIKENIVFSAERGVTPTMEVPSIPGYGSTKKVASASTSKTQEKEKLDKKKGAAGSETGKKTAPKKATFVRRKEELIQLYGKDSDLIQGLETSLQLNFNRNCDTFKPELYPAVTLNPQAVDA